MARCELSPEDLKEIAERIPDLEDLGKKIQCCDPYMFSSAIKLPKSSRLPEAGVCFQDAFGTLADATYALHEYHAHWIWYMERREPPSPDAAMHYCRFYLDDLALRLYSAELQLADAIKAMFGLRRDVLKPFKEKDGEFGTLSRYLAETGLAARCANALAPIVGSKCWKNSVTYRNAWVHAQPPLIEGPGPGFKRTPKWRDTEDGGRFLPLKVRDRPRYTVQDVFAFLEPSLRLLVGILEGAFDDYCNLLREIGITIDDKGIEVQILE